MKVYHTLYKTICVVTENFYIGIHSSSDPEDCYIGSGLRLHNSVKKYGRENHVKTVLETFDTREDLLHRESEVVNEEMLANPRCMNLKKGGEGGWHSNANQAFVQKLASNSDFRQKISEERSRVMTKTHSEGKIKGNIANMNGKRASHETLSRVRSGEKNSQHGSCWIQNDTETKKVRKDDFEAYLKTGWRKGRKINSGRPGLPVGHWRNGSVAGSV
jgi:hypothetical protein